ncbi:hypothetical protein FIV02_21585 [Pseudomonas sp. THAF187a]|nr:hypothetical protein FIV02_21585 [Pseudomonas sp. THAF187a]QFT44344.1 hypothetical protein FIU98_21565 [Pseudomonas sp. THAF42]
MRVTERYLRDVRDNHKLNMKSPFKINRLCL